MRSSRPDVPVLLLAMLAGLPALVQAQRLDSLVVRVGAMSAVTGLEDAMADTLLTLLPNSRRDRAGNVIQVRGTGEPVRLAACPMDEIGYVVGSITEDGYMALRRVGGTNVGPLYDQFLEGHRVTVFGRRGPVPGVVGVKSTHLTRGRAAGDDPVFVLDNAWVDIGAQSARDVAALGIQVLSPVTRAKTVHRYGAQGAMFAAPWIAQRAACAALLSAALRASTGPGTTVIAFTARRHFNNDGLLFVLSTYPTAAVLSLGGTATAAMGTGPANAADTIGGRAAAAWTLPVRYFRSPAETVGLADVAQLEQRIIGWLGGAR